MPEESVRLRYATSTAVHDRWVNERHPCRQEDTALTFLTIQRASSRPRCMISASRWGSVSAEKLTNADLRKA